MAWASDDRLGMLMARPMMMVALATGVVATASLGPPPPFNATAQSKAPRTAEVTATDYAAGLEALRAQDLRVAQVGFALRAANQDRCPRLGPLPGWTLHAAAQYSNRVRSHAQVHFGLRGGYPSLLAVVAGSPAADAGLKPDDVLLAVNDQALGSDDPIEGDASYDSLATATALLERELSRPATLQILRDGQPLKVAILANQGCLIESQVDPSSRLQAQANAQRVFITTAMIDFAGSDDELAFVLGHEYAHIILGHTPPPSDTDETPKARGAAAARWPEAQELAADRLGLSLAQSAGFNVAAAPSLIGRLAVSRSWLTFWSGRSRLLVRRRVELERAAAGLDQEISGPRRAHGTTTPPLF